MSLKGNRIMAKANRTTSTPRRATAAKATIKRLAPATAVDTIRRNAELATDQQYRPSLGGKQ
jgi:hypothetical protein